MTLRWYTTVIDCHDIQAQSRWWAGVLDWRIGYESADEVVLIPPHAVAPARAVPAAERGPALTFVRVLEGKAVKNRMHIDLAPGDQEAEVARLEALGARPADVGQGDVTWVVLADPEGNEFCVLSARD